jgi:prepilin-type N-terminal cleavage/methylation domain-containing protein
MPRQSGFTLIEILTVLVIAGLLAALAAPPLLRLIGSTERSSQRGLLAGEITSLAYRAWLEGKPYTLGGDAKAATAYALHLSAGWRVECPKPITYAFNGICGGGRLSLLGPDGYREDWRLEGPRCDQLLPVQ